MKKTKKYIFYLIVIIYFLIPSMTKADASNVTTSDYKGMKKISFQSDCTKYTLSGPSGLSGTQLYHNIYYNPASSGTKPLIWFQHGDASKAPRNACESRFYATQVLSEEQGKNYIIFCPEMNPSNGTGAKLGIMQSLWSINYGKPEVFDCLYNDFVNVAKGAGLTISKDTIFASHSQGGPATSKITLNVSAHPKIKVVKIIRFDSCYGNQCINEASIPAADRGPLIAYVSDVHPAGAYENNEKNKAAVIEPKIWLKPNVTAYLVNGKNHTEVPQLCTLDFLKNNNCAGKATPQGGTVTDIAGSGGTAVSSITAPGGETLGGYGPTFNEIKLILQKPKLQVRLPGVNFSDITEVDDNGTKFLFIPFLGEYLAAGYKYAIIIAGIFATAMILNAGFTLLMAAGSSEKVTYAKKRIGEALIGLLLAVGSYVFLYTINPELVNFRNLRVMAIRGIPWEGNEYGDPTETGEIPDSGPIADITQIPKGGGPADCGKNLAGIALAYANLTPHLALESCSCAFFVSLILKDSGCDKSFSNYSAGGLRTQLMNKGWKEIPLSSAQPGDLVFYWKEDRSKISHATVFYKTENGKYYIIDANTDFRHCWTDQQKKEVNSKCNGEQAFKTSKTNAWGVQNDSTKLKKGQVGDQYQQCIASLGICPMLEDYRPDLCANITTIKDRAVTLLDYDASERCPTRQCVKSQALTANGLKKNLYSVLQNPLK